MVHLTKIIPVLGLTLLVACQPPDREADPDVASDTLPTVTAETHRQQIEGAMRDTRDRVEELGARISGRSEDAWNRLSEQADETWSEIESGLARIRDDDPESIHRSREEAARRLAELEAELVEVELATARTPEELRAVSDEWLGRVESDVNRLEQLLPQAAERADVDLDRDDLREVRERTQEIRADAQEALSDRDEFEVRREEIAEDLSEIVREVREAHYRLQWRHRATARR